MAKPVDQDPWAMLAALKRKVDRFSLHTHAGIVADPATISGSRSNPEDILEQLLAALAADGLINDETTG